MKELMRANKNEWGISKLQNCILNVAQYVDKFCTENDIEYCLMGGSALGAVRHGGFIPWDDDLDIFMKPKDYAKFRQLFAEKGNHEEYYLQEWGGQRGKVSLAKVRLNNSMLIEKDLKDWDIHQGVYIDIFILHPCPNNKLARFHQYVWAKYLVAKGAAKKHYTGKRGLVGLLIKIFGWLPDHFLVGFALNQLYAFDNWQTASLCHYTGRATWKSGLYKRSYFETVKRVPFETIELNVPSAVEDYLRDRWGDYMKLPDYEEIKHFQHSWKWSDTEPFPGSHPDKPYVDEVNLIA